MRATCKTTKDDLGKTVRALEGLQGRKIKVGVLDGENAWLAGIHEYGLRIAVTPKMRAFLQSRGLHLRASTQYINIPERSFLRAGFDAHNQAVLKKAEALLPGVLEGSMTAREYCEAVGLELATKIKRYAVALKNPPNHPFTLDQKGSGNPLVDTGDMIESITFEVE